MVNIVVDEGERQREDWQANCCTSESLPGHIWQEIRLIALWQNSIKLEESLNEA